MHQVIGGSFSNCRVDGVGRFVPAGATCRIVAATGHWRNSNARHSKFHFVAEIPDAHFDAGFQDLPCRGFAAGGDFALALLGNGSVEAWGDDEQGQLGNITAEEEASATWRSPSNSLTGVTAVAAGENHALALLGGGSVVGWGDDSFGELGNGTVKARSAAPVPVSALSGVRSISAGGQDSVALRVRAR